MSITVSDLQKALDLATTFFKALTRLFAALELAGATPDEPESASYYSILATVHDGAQKIIESEAVADMLD